MPDINNIGLKVFVDKKLSNETSDEKEMIKEAAPVAVNGELGCMFSYKELDSNGKMTIETVHARGNNIYDLEPIPKFDRNIVCHDHC